MDKHFCILIIIFQKLGSTIKINNLYSQFLKAKNAHLRWVVAAEASTSDNSSRSERSPVGRRSSSACERARTEAVVATVTRSQQEEAT